MRAAGETTNSSRLPAAIVPPAATRTAAAPADGRHVRREKPAPPALPRWAERGQHEVAAVPRSLSPYYAARDSLDVPRDKKSALVSARRGERLDDAAFRAAAQQSLVSAVPDVELKWPVAQHALERLHAADKPFPTLTQHADEPAEPSIGT